MSVALDLTPEEQEHLDGLVAEMAQCDARHQQAVEGIAELVDQRREAERRAAELRHEIAGATGVLARARGVAPESCRVLWNTSERRATVAHEEEQPTPAAAQG